MDNGNLRHRVLSFSRINIQIAKMQKPTIDFSRKGQVSIPSLLLDYTAFTCRAIVSQRPNVGRYGKKTKRV